MDKTPEGYSLDELMKKINDLNDGKDVIINFPKTILCLFHQIFEIKSKMIHMREYITILKEEISELRRDVKRIDREVDEKADK